MFLEFVFIICINELLLLFDIIFINYLYVISHSPPFINIKKTSLHDTSAARLPKGIDASWPGECNSSIRGQARYVADTAAFNGQPLVDMIWVKL